MSEQRALEQLARFTDSLREMVRAGYEHRAKSCETCEEQGACCLDVHFVNIRISRLEARRILKTLDRLPASERESVEKRIEHAIQTFKLGNESNSDHKFACPLYEASVGCLVHDGGKPVPCIMHACYEDASHLPPQYMADSAELAIDRLNTRAYGPPQPLLPLPVAIKRWRSAQR